jgi:hypothetical protein
MTLPTCFDTIVCHLQGARIHCLAKLRKYEGWNFNSGNYLFTTDTK